MKQPNISPSAEQLSSDEQALLAHYREHQLAQPKPAMDARILAAAEAQVAHCEPAIMSVQQRLQRWLFGVGQPLRWSLAFASLASIGLGLSFTLSTLDQLPPAYDLGEPQSVMRAPVQPQALKKQQLPAMNSGAAMPASPPLINEGRNSNEGSSARQAERVAEPAALLESLQADSQPAPPLADESAEHRLSQAKSIARAAPLEKAAKLPSLEQALRAVLHLQRSGATEQAALELRRLQQLYPGHDILAELAQLQADPLNAR